MKKLLGILFAILHTVISYLGSNFLFLYWFVPHERSTGKAIAAIIILFLVSSLYLLLVRKKMLGIAPSVACYVGNLVFWGILWLGAAIFMFGGNLAFTYFLVPISLVVQSFVLFHHYKTG